jgi:beta-lactamase superfamily II metal-dependent hydrolase
MLGQFNGDSILITSAGGKTVLIDAGDTSKGKVVVDALKRNNVQQLDYLIITHPHPDHMGGATEVFKAVKVLNVMTTDSRRLFRQDLAPAAKPTPAPKKSIPGKPSKLSSITKFYDDYKQR